MALFGGKKKKKDTKPLASEQVIEFPPVDIYTLPARFLPSGKTKRVSKGSGGISGTTILLVFVFVVLAIGGGFVWWYFSQQQQTTTAPLDDINITPLQDTIDNEDDESDEVTDRLPPPITHIAKDNTGAVSGELVLQLSANDNSLIEVIQISSQDVSSDQNQVVSSGFSINPASRRLSGVAELSIQYDDDNLSSIVENSLKIAYLKNDGTWQFDDRSQIDLGLNTVTLEIDQLPGALIAVVSNITQGTLPNDDEILPDNDIEYELSDLKASLDSDGDGLTDVEEILYETEFNKPDTDLDGYVDGSEVLSLYSPRDAGSSLLESGQFDTYLNPSYGYTIAYPTSWSVNEIDGLGNVVMFTSATNQFVEVVVEQKSPLITDVADWYKQQVPGVDDDLLRFTTIGEDGTTAVISLDGAIAYFIVGDLVIGIGYNQGIEPEADYLTTWEAMKSSWVLSEEDTATSTPEEDNTPDENA
ncbi:MAG: hypothetical protein ACPGO5_00950 [Patescibacteria group bacterium]